MNGSPETERARQSRDRERGTEGGGFAFERSDYIVELCTLTFRTARDEQMLSIE
jgi:hypothetical protein